MRCYKQLSLLYSTVYVAAATRYRWKGNLERGLRTRFATWTSPPISLPSFATADILSRHDEVIDDPTVHHSSITLISTERHGPTNHRLGFQSGPARQPCGASREHLFRYSAAFHLIVPVRSPAHLASISLAEETKEAMVDPFHCPDDSYRSDPWGRVLLQHRGGSLAADHGY
jgi:hypothetical protein